MATKKKTAKPWWPQAKKLCRLNQDDIEMAKRLGFKPEGLLKARPSPKDRWKLPVKDWIRSLYVEKFGQVLGEKPLKPVLADGSEAARIFEEASPVDVHPAEFEEDREPCTLTPENEAAELQFLLEHLHRDDDVPF